MGAPCSPSPPGGGRRRHREVALQHRASVCVCVGPWCCSFSFSSVGLAGKEERVGGVPAACRLRVAAAGPPKFKYNGEHVSPPRAPVGDALLRAGVPPYSRPRLESLPRASVSPLMLRSPSPRRARPRVASAGHPSPLTSTQAPAIFRGPLVRLQRRRSRRAVRS
ncbi:hypothetical protein NDU88_006778 [Pleurodeles waltl]|uniref:Uncharacterized protein n=1 Tax=Pleurodeles waltl TaxID=8319 RepID=A0AAV7N205_PLEWA|nr:hypothetical protein NDU88_006778 [Pleurodeles waltl]